MRLGPEDEDDHWDPLWDEDEDDDDLAELSCGELPEGGCSLAGTEWCDWSCPFSDGMSARATKKRRNSHSAGK